MNEAGVQKKTNWTVPGPNEPLFIAASPAMQEVKTWRRARPVVMRRCS